MRECVLPGVRDYVAAQQTEATLLSDRYKESLAQLVMLQTEDVTHFYGCSLDLPDNKDVWMSPVEVDDGEDFSYFQVLYVNITPEEALGNQSLPVSLLEIDEASFKLTPADHPGYQQLARQFDNERQHVLIRRCNTGMAYFPRSIVPGLGEEKATDHLERVIAATGLREPEAKISLSKPSEHEHGAIKTDLLQTVHARKYPFGNGEVHSYGLVIEDDPWGYYEVFTPRRLEDMPTEDLLLRIDSGCDIGQIYDDRGCDCREQLHTALFDIQELGEGAVIHIPAQDGRGFGAATKMETEGLKRGIPVATNKDDLRELDTITAAQLILGQEFDIRTYRGAGKLLAMIGVESVTLQTDNRLKAEGLEAGGIKVTRRATNTTGANGSHRHVEAKHKHTGIYYGAED